MRVRISPAAPKYQTKCKLTRYPCVFYCGYMAKKEATINDLDKKMDNLTGTVSDLSKTVGGLSKTVDGLSKTVNNLSETVDNLAIITKKGFDAVYKDMRKGFSDVDKRMEKFETGQEDIKLRLDNTAYRFELEELKKRVTVLEKSKFA